jgi:signal transduction histidine kinase
MMDVTGNVLYTKEKSHNMLLSLINATVSHELRNPLNSINA